MTPDQPNGLSMYAFEQAKERYPTMLKKKTKQKQYAYFRDHCLVVNNIKFLNSIILMNWVQ